MMVGLASLCSQMVTLMANELSGQETLVKAIPQNELTLVALRDSALDLLLNRNTPSTFESTARKTAQGLEVDTTQTSDKNRPTSRMIVDGTADVERPSLGWGKHGFHLDTRWDGNFTITHINGARSAVETGTFAYTGGMWDDVMSRHDRSSITMTRMDADGKPFQKYVPAYSEMVSAGGRLALDPNGQPLRTARLAGNAANCGLDFSNRGGGNFDCNYMIQDARFGQDLSYNETHQKHPAYFSYRSVVRDTKGTVLGIVEQNFNVDGNGDLTRVTTRARRPEEIRK